MERDNVTKVGAVAPLVISGGVAASAYSDVADPAVFIGNIAVITRDEAIAVAEWFKNAVGLFPEPQPRWRIDTDEDGDLAVIVQGVGPTQYWDGQSVCSLSDVWPAHTTAETIGAAVTALVHRARSGPDFVSGD